MSARRGSLFPSPDAGAPRGEAAVDAVLSVRELSMQYPNGVLAVDNVSLSIAAGEFVALLGGNGSGKTTFLKCVARLLRPSAGQLRVDGRDFAGLKGRQLRQARQCLALVFQQANLIKRRSVLANVLCGALGRHIRIDTMLGRLPLSETETAWSCLRSVGTAHLAHQRADELSGGQSQRVAIARALAQHPKLLLADEPVASLDPEAAEDVMGLLRRLATEQGLAVLCVLHQPELALRFADRVVGFRGGRLVYDVPAANASTRQINGLYAGPSV